MDYTTISEIEAGFRTLTEAERQKAEGLIDEASALIDIFAPDADEARKRLVAARMVRRSVGDDDGLMPMGATQGSMSAGGYTQSWTIGSNGSTGELYISKLEKKLLGIGNRIGSCSPLEEFCEEYI